MMSIGRKEWVGNSSFSVSTSRVGEVSIVSNGLNRVKVLVYITPIGPDRNPLTRGELSDMEVRRSLKLIDYSGVDSDAFIKNPRLDDYGRPTIGDSRPENKRWYYSDESNIYDCLPWAGSPQLLEKDSYPLSDLQVSEVNESSVRIIDFYIFCMFSGPGRVMVAASVTLPDGTVRDTSITNPGSQSFVAFRSIQPYSYSPYDCKIEYSNWHRLDAYIDSTVEMENEPVFYGMTVLIRPIRGNNSFLKSKIKFVPKDAHEIEGLKRLFYQYDIAYLRRYSMSSKLGFTFYAWDINHEGEGQNFGDPPGQYKLLGRGYRHCYAKVPTPQPFVDSRGAFQVLVIQQALSSSTGKAQDYPLTVVLFDEYGDSGSFDIKMSECDTDQAVKISLNNSH